MLATSSWLSGMEAPRAHAPLWSERSTRGKRFTSSWARLLLKIGNVPVAIAVRTRLFARLRELAHGAEPETLELPAGSSLGDVYEGLRLIHAALPDRGGVRAALNQEFSDWNATVADGDEVAFIPPVSGGTHGGGVFGLTVDPLDARGVEGGVAPSGAGAIFTFTGVGPGTSPGPPLTHPAYPAYPGM